MIEKIPGIPMFRRMAANKVGRDFFVTDPHGCFTLLEYLLKNAQFDPTKDRLFIAGDLVDRGPESHLALEWLQRSYVFSTRGNHDQMLLDAANNGYDHNHENNGGEWFMRVMKEDPELAEEFRQVFSGLPIALEVECWDGRRFGIVHGECPFFDWNDFTEALEHETEPKRFDNIVLSAIWMRTRITNEDVTPITGIDTVFVGHTSVNEIVELGNTLYLDTGAVFDGGKLTLMQMDNRQTWTLSRQQLLGIRMREQEGPELS